MFSYVFWESFCKNLNEMAINSIRACDLIDKGTDKNFLILKHDIENSVGKALKVAEIENKYSHLGSYYFQGRLLKNSKNIKKISRIAAMGHEISYHHDVMDSNDGDIQDAMNEFKEYLTQFQQLGISIKTVCQHGNPIKERKGYTSNRDFFRDKRVRGEFNNVFDIMVNYKQKIGREYIYISDAGYGWKIITDPENDDLRRDGKNYSVDIETMLDLLDQGNNMIVSIHPHRYCNSHFALWFRKNIHAIAREMAKTLQKNDFTNRMLSKLYFLAKKL